MFSALQRTAQTTFHSTTCNTDSVLWAAQPTVMHCAQTWQSGTCLNGGIFGLPCHMRKVICDFRRKLLPPSSGWLNVSEVDAEEIDRNELAFYTGRTIIILAFQGCDWPKFPPNLLYSLQLPSIYFAHLNQSQSTWKRTQYVLTKR